MTLRRFLFAAAAAGLLGLVAAVVMSLRVGEDRDPILQGALTALGDGPVLHAVVREQLAVGPWYEVPSGRPVAVQNVYESWVDWERGRIHSIERRNDRLARDAVLGAEGVEREQTTAKLVFDYARRLEDDELRVLRDGTVGGRKVHWLGSPTAEAAVDSRTHRLVRIQTLGGHFRTHLDFDLLESEPRRASDFAISSAAPVVVAPRLTQERVLGVHDAAQAVNGAQWAGRRVGALRLHDVRTSVWRARLRPGGEVRGRLLVVRYGERLGTPADPAAGLPRGVELVQASEKDPSRRAVTRPGQPAPPPAGTFDLSRRIDASGTRHEATLRKPGVWILVRASSRELLFETVRALRPIS